MSSRIVTRLTILATTVLLAILFTTVGSEWSQPTGAQSSAPPQVHTFVMGITPSQFLRVCFGRVAGAPGRTQDIALAHEWLAPNGSAFLTKRLAVPGAGFQCVDTTADELRLAGFTPETSGRVQFALAITPQEPVTAGDNMYGAIETIDLPSGETRAKYTFSGWARWESNF